MQIFHVGYSKLNSTCTLPNSSAEIYEFKTTKLHSLLINKKLDLYKIINGDGGQENKLTLKLFGRWDQFHLIGTALGYKTYSVGYM